jgi:outer membrane protein, adhesin transport system
VRVGAVLLTGIMLPAMAAGQDATSSTQGASSLSAAGNLATPGTASTPSLPPLPGAARPIPSTPAPGPSLSVGPTPSLLSGRLPSPLSSTGGQPLPDRLPLPGGSPLAIDFSTDPIIRFAHRTAAGEQFRQVIARAVEAHPAVAEANAAAREADAAVSQARSGLFPTVDLTFTADRSVSRRFGDDDNSIIERVRPRGRTDANATVTQTVLDFGGTARRIKAARARADAAEADIDSAADDVALRAISAWYDLAAYRALVTMGTALEASEQELVVAVRERIRQGIAAESDLARIQTYTSSTQARLAQFRRSLTGAEARYLEVVGLPPPPVLDRPDLPIALPPTAAEARVASHGTGQVRSAQAAARAAEADYRSTVSDLLPRVQAVVDAGRYGVFENDRDYDVRGRLVLRHRLFGGGVSARRDQAEQRYLQARASADRVEQEAERDAAITFSDVAASDIEVAALEQAYRANRQSRDVLAERFRYTQGSLIDVLNAEDTFFQVAAQLIQAVVRRDAQRLVLAQRSGILLSALGVDFPETRR